ncbi:MAG: hypothetical protein EOM91_08325 [Sphingobacteriia bacterium]|nr:hypothetical protein [Sphingobacteriia bacterium]NCC39727.1 hypothetical protein [Gammaproteobacteria bacterium]
MDKSKSAASSVTSTKTKGVAQSSLSAALLPTIVLYVAAVVLVMFTRDDPASTIAYWETFIPVVAFISLMSGFGPAYVREQSHLAYILKQILHWGIVIGMLWLLHTHGIRGALSDPQYLLVLMYTLALTVLLVGLHLDFKLIFFGAFLACCAYLQAAPENVALLGLIGDTFGIANAQEKPLTMIIGIAVVAFLANALMLIGTRGAVMSKRVSEAKR